MAYNAVTVTTTATLIVAANAARKDLNIVNFSNSTIVYIGPDELITTANTVPLYQNQGWGFKKEISEHWKGPVYGIVASGTASVRYWEVTQ